MLISNPINDIVPFRLDINIEALESGLYLFVIETDKGQIVERIVKQ